MDIKEICYMPFLRKVADIVYGASTLIGSGVNDVQVKDSFENYVTDVDKKVEAYLIQELSKILPEAKILSEETHSECGDLSNEMAWVIDPIDGTANLKHGLPGFTVSVGLMYNYAPILGVVYDYAQDWTYYAADGVGAFLEDHEIKVSEESMKSGIAICGTGVYSKNRSAITFEKMRRLFMECEDVRIYGSAALAMCMVASGSAEIAHYSALAPWDYCAGLAILKNAGGFCMSNLRERKSVCWAANREDTLNRMASIVS